MLSSKSKRRKMSYSSKLSQLENNFGSKNSIGSLLLMDGWSYLVEIPIKMNCLWSVIWRLGIFICILIMEELPQLSSKVLQSLEYLLLQLWNRQLSLLSADQKLGTLKLSALLGGYIMTRFQNPHPLESFYQQVHLWLEENVISFIPIECKWEWLFFIDWIMNQWLDILNIKRIFGRKVKIHKSLG